MPSFTPGSVHSAVTTFSNPKSAGFDYVASLCMGAAWTEMASVSFHLDAGQSKAVTFSIIMPTTTGTYPVYFKIFSGGVLIGAFAAEAVVITPPLSQVSIGIELFDSKGNLIPDKWAGGSYFGGFHFYELYGGAGASYRARITVTNTPYPATLTLKVMADCAVPDIYGDRYLKLLFGWTTNVHDYPASEAYYRDFPFTIPSDAMLGWDPAATGSLSAYVLSPEGVNIASIKKWLMIY